MRSFVDLVVRRGVLIFVGKGFLIVVVDIEVEVIDVDWKCDLMYFVVDWGYCR